MSKDKKRKTQLQSLFESKDYQSAPGVYGFTEIEKIKFPEIITTSSVGLDILLEGGFRCGWSKWMGDFESGKTSMGLCWGKNWQEFFPENGKVIYYNTEGRLDKSRLLDSGIDYDNIEKFEAVDWNNADKIFDSISDLITNNSEGYRYFFMIDSLNSMRRTVDMDKSFEEAEKVGAAGLLLSAAGSKLSLPMGRNGHHMYFTAQIRANVNTRGPAGNPVSSGPNAPKFYCSLTGEIQKLWTDLYIFEEPSDVKSKRVGHLQTIKFTKTFNQKTGTIIQIPIKYGLKGGVWKGYEAYILGLQWGFIEKAGAWITLKDELSDELSENKIVFPSKIQGEKNMRLELDKHPEFVNYILDKIKTIAV